MFGLEFTFFAFFLLFSNWGLDWVLLFFGLVFAFFPRASERRVLPIVGVCISPSHLHICSSSHLLIFTSSLTSAHLHICSSSYLLSHLLSHLLSSAHFLHHIFSHVFSHICSSSHLLIFTSSLTSAHLHSFSHIFSHICSSSHLLIFTSAHLHIFSHICSSSHLLIFTSSLTSAHLHIFSHICSSSHLLIFTPSLTSSHLHIFSPFSLLFLSLAFFIFLSLGRGWYRRWVTKRQLFRTKWGSIGKNWGKIAIWLVPGATLSHEMRVDRQKPEVKLRFDLPWSNPFARNEGRSAKTAVKLRFDLSRSNPFARNEGRSAKTEVKLGFYLCPGATLSHEMRVDRQKLR